MKEEKNQNIYRRLARYIIPYWALFLVSMAGFAIYASTQPMFAMFIKHIVDSLNSDAREQLVYLPGLLLGLFFVRGVGSFFGNYSLAKISANIVHKLRCEIFDQYASLPTRYFDENTSGHMMSRITHNVGEVTRATTNSVRTFIRESFTALGLLVYLVIADWKLSLVFLVIAPLVAVIVNYVSKRLRRLSKKAQVTVGDMNHITSEMVLGHKTVRSFGGEEYEKKRFKKSSLDNRRQNLKLIMTVSLNNPLMQFIVSLALAALMYLALVMMKDAGAGDFVGYFTAAFLLPKPVRQLSDAYADIQRGVAAAETLFEVLDEPLEDKGGDYVPAQVKGEIRFENVSFKYGENDAWILKDINLSIKPGQSVALVGLSGSGKTSLINLLPRFYDYQEGRILLDGVELKQYRLNSLRNNIALVSQNVTLFNDTVTNNIAYGALRGAEKSAVINAAKDAYAKEFIEKMPQGFDTDIGENGVRLSGGQRQRLALARALLKNAPVLILDEATSALDTESEQYIQKALKKVMKNRTTLVVAHRLTTIENADVILVMEKGSIIEQGNHQELIAKNGAYAKLHGVQVEKT